MRPVCSVTACLPACTALIDSGCFINFAVAIREDASPARVSACVTQAPTRSVLLCSTASTALAPVK